MQHNRHNKPSIKRTYLARVRAHTKADEIIHAALQAGAWVVNPLRGTVRSTRFKDNHILGTRNTKGYLVATLHFSGERIQAKLHRVVWMSVFGYIKPGLMIDHINGKKFDNRIENLRLVTNAGNAKNRRSYCGTANPSARLTEETASAIRSSAGSYATRANHFGVSKSLVAQISRGELWT